MKLDQAVGILTRPELQVQHARRPHTLAVEVFQPGALGGTPCSVVVGIDVGFDWNAGTVMIRTAEPLTRLTPEEVADIRVHVAKGTSMEAYTKFTSLRDRIKALEAAIQAVTEADHCPNDLRSLLTTALEKPK